VNKLTITVWGNVATEPMHVVGPGGRPRTTFRLASTPRKRHEDGSYVDGATSFFNVTCFGYLAVNVAASVHKGEPVVLFADLTIREWQAEGGRSGKDADLVASHVGPDLRWGRAHFERAARPPRQDGEPSRTDAPQAGDVAAPSAGQAA
jgi:single-strand DNA-binding protein